VPDTLTPEDIKRELARRLAEVPEQEREKLTAVFIELAAGKYITGKRWNKARRNALIRSLFDGRNLHQLARDFDLSPRHIRRLAAGK